MSDDYLQDNNHSGRNINLTSKKIEDFLEIVWGYTSVDAKCFSIVWFKGKKPNYHIFCLKPLLKEKIENKKAIIVENYNELYTKVAELVKELGKDTSLHIYYQVLPLAEIPKWGRGSANNVRVGKVLWADIDYKREVEKEEFQGCKELEDYALNCFYREGNKINKVDRPPLTTILNILRNYNLEPTFVVDSGAGYHLYWLLDIEIDAKELKALEDKLIDFLNSIGIKVDAKAKDLARVLRLPFTINPRTGREVKIIYESGGIYSTKELGRILKTEAKESKGFVALSDLQLDKIKELVKPAYRKGSRNQLCLFLSGWLAKARVHPLQTVKIIKALHDETNDEEFLTSRCNPIVYSYSKAGLDITPFIEEIEKECGGKLSGEGKQHIGSIKGKSGIQEILEEVLGEEKALSIIEQIEEILNTASPFKDSVFEILNYRKKIFAVANPRTKIIAKAKLEDGRMDYDEIAAIVAPAKVTVYESPLDGETRKFEVVFEGKTLAKPLSLPPMEVDDIVIKLKKEGLVYDDRLITKLLPAVLNAFIKKGKAEIKPNILQPGFFILDDKLIANNFEIKEATKGELKEALILLDVLASTWYKKVIERFSLVIKWGIISPFIFARKQLGTQYQVPDLVLYGERNTGKTTLAEIAVVHLWGLDRAKHSLPFSEGNSEAKFGRLISQSTFARVLNECNSIFYKPEIVNLMKSKIESKVARGRHEKVNEYKQYLALSGLIYTLNPKPEVDFVSLELIPKTALLLTFTTSEKLTTDEISKFRKEVEPNLNKLSAVGQWVAKYLLKHQGLLKTEDWVELAEKLLEEAYKDAGLEPPSWIKLRYETITPEELIEEKRLRIVARLGEAVNKLYKDYIGKLIETKGPENYYVVDHVTIKDKIDVLSNSNLLPWAIRKDSMLYITTGVLEILSGLQIANLKDLAEVLGIEDKYKPKRSIRVGKKVMSIDVIELSIDEFADILEPEVS